MKNKEKAKTEAPPADKISRKKAIKKAGFYALTATSMLLLGTQKSAAASLSPADNPVW